MCSSDLMKIYFLSRPGGEDLFEEDGEELALKLPLPDDEVMAFFEWISVTDLSRTQNTPLNVADQGEVRSMEDDCVEDEVAMEGGLQSSGSEYSNNKEQEDLFGQNNATVSVSGKITVHMRLIHIYVFYASANLNSSNKEKCLKIKQAFKASNPL